MSEPTDGVEAMPSHQPESEAPPAEAVLIRRAREACGLSPEAAAKRLKITLSGRRWRQLEEARDSGTGRRTEISNAVLAHMAYVVRVTPEQLAGAGRAEAAEVLREIERQERHLAESAESPDSLTAEPGTEVPSYVTQGNTEDWEWEIWQRLTLLSSADKELVIEFLKGVRRRARAADDVDNAHNTRRRAG